MTNWQPLEPNAPQNNVEQPVQPVQDGMQQPAPLRPMMGAQPGPKQPGIFRVLKVFGYIFTALGVLGILVGGISVFGEFDSLPDTIYLYDAFILFGVAQAVTILSLMLVAMCTYFEKKLGF